MVAHVQSRKSAETLRHQSSQRATNRRIGRQLPRPAGTPASHWAANDDVIRTQQGCHHPTDTGKPLGPHCHQPGQDSRNVLGDGATSRALQTRIRRKCPSNDHAVRRTSAPRRPTSPSDQKRPQHTRCLRPKRLRQPNQAWGHRQTPRRGRSALGWPIKHTAP